MKQSSSTERVATRHSYKTYKEVCLQYNYTPVPLSDYLYILNEFFKFLMNLVFEGYQVKLPARMGSLCVKGWKQKPRVVNGEIKGLAPDWVKTKAYWESNPEAKAAKKLLYHFNEHTQGVRYRIHWDKKNVITENINFYSLKLTWTNKRTLHKLLVEGKEYFVENN